MSGTFQVDFQSLTQILAQNLYINPKAAVRELIQNASDSCVRRQATESFEPAITVTTRPKKYQLVFEDNGRGMVKEEVVNYLASIGGGGTRVARKQLSTKNQQAAGMLIGQFGIGFLSSFVVAEKVVVDTCASDGGTPIRWVCEGTAKYKLSTGKRDKPGTRVTLYLKPEHYDLVEEDVLRGAIVRYADFIAFPIYLNKEATPINRMDAPWYTDGLEAEYAGYLAHRYEVTPLALEPIAFKTDDLAVNGVLFIPPHTADFQRRLRSVDLFQKRMYIGEDLALLPEWAGFVCAVLDCPSLELVASRDAIISDRPAYNALREYLRAVVAAFVKRLAADEPAAFLEVIEHHEWSVLYGAIRDDDFFELVKNLIPLTSDIGPLTVDKYLARVPAQIQDIKTIYYILAEQPLCQQRRGPTALSRGWGAAR